MNTFYVSLIFTFFIAGTYLKTDQNNTNVENQAKVQLADAIKKLDSSDRQYLEFFEHGTMRVGLYGPVEIDKQSPHDQDELYVIAQGTGRFVADGTKHYFETGDVLFVGAHTDHRFVEFSRDFKTWVFFYGPDGGES